MSLSARIAEAQLALMLLTRLPAGDIHGKPPTTSQCIWAFPLIGAGLGAVAGVVFWLATVLGLPALVAALLAIASTVFLTGALHEDGLADVADGFGGGATRERKLEIMRDSRLGSYGAVALILVLALIASSIAETGDLTIFIAIGALSRAAMILPMVTLHPARKDGLGAAAAAHLDTHTAAALVLTVPFVLLAPWPATMAALAAFAIIGLAQKQIGGQTGDVLGATQKLTECVAWITATTL